MPTSQNGQTHLNNSSATVVVGSGLEGLKYISNGEFLLSMLQALLQQSSGNHKKS